jgi:voltage-gated potassium channel
MGSSRTSKLLVADLALMRALLQRLIVPTLLALATFLFGAFGFYAIGKGRWSLFDCAYMTSITLTTVGYGEVLEELGPEGRFFAMVLMWSGMGVTLYAVSTITAFFVETDLWKILRERRMEKRIAALSGHIIVCGAGKTGINVIKEIYTTRRPCVVIEGDRERLQQLQEDYGDLFCLCGDATDEGVLEKAGIQNAAGLIATLSDDSHNLLITVQARYINPNITIVSRCEENSLADKFYRAGSNYVVNPAFIGGMRMASQMIRPHVVSFLDRMLRSKDLSIRVEEVVLDESSSWVGRNLGEIDVYRQTGLIPIALKQPDQEEYHYNPSPQESLRSRTVLIVIGNPDQISRLRAFCHAGKS